MSNTPETPGACPHIDTYIDDLLEFASIYRRWQVAPVNTGLCETQPDAVVYESDTAARVCHGNGSLTAMMFMMDTDCVCDQIVFRSIVQDIASKVFAIVRTYRSNFKS